jgi:hypothetical protein
MPISREHVACKVAVPVIDLVEPIVIFCLPLVAAIASLAKQMQLILQYAFLSYIFLCGYNISPVISKKVEIGVRDPF